MCESHKNTEKPFSNQKKSFSFSTAHVTHRYLLWKYRKCLCLFLYIMELILMIYLERNSLFIEVFFSPALS